MKILDLYAGGGGISETWIDHNVVHVENNPERCEYLRNKFPDHKVIEANAEEFILWHAEEFDLISIGSPCINNTKFNTTLHYNKIRDPVRRLPDQKWYDFMRWLDYYHPTIKYICENVESYFKPTIKPTVTLGRHLFWSNFKIPERKFKANKPDQLKKGIERDMVNPEIGKYILECYTNTIPIPLEEWFT